MKSKLTKAFSAILAGSILLGCVALTGCGDSGSKEPAGPSEEQLTAVRDDLKTNKHMEGLGDVTKMEL